MRKYFCLFLSIFIYAQAYSSWNGIEKLTPEERASKLSACKKLKAENKLLELTAKDWSVCNKLLSEDLMSSYENNPKSITKHQTEKKEKTAICKEIVLRNLTDQLSEEKKKICKSLIEEERKEYKHQQYAEEERNEYKYKQYIEIAENIGGVLLFLFCCWFLLFVVLPKLIYVIRKAWLKAAEDAKK